MPVKQCWVLEALMEQPLPQLLLQLQLPPHPQAGLQEGQMRDPLPLRLLVHRVRKDLGLRPGASGSDGGPPGAAAVDVGSG